MEPVHSSPILPSGDESAPAVDGSILPSPHTSTESDTPVLVTAPGITIRDLRFAWILENIFESSYLVAQGSPSSAATDKPVLKPRAIASEPDEVDSDPEEGVRAPSSVMEMAHRGESDSTIQYEQK
jgi:hypothetical protein